MYFFLISLCRAQNSPLPAPSMAGPLQQLPPSAFKAGPLGTLNINGVLSGMGLWQSNHVPGDNTTHVAPAARGATPVEPRGRDLVRERGARRKPARVVCDDAQQSYRAKSCPPKGLRRRPVPASSHLLSNVSHCLRRCSSPAPGRRSQRGPRELRPGLPGNGQIILQKTEGWWQFYVQAGAYNLPVLGAPFLSTERTLTNFFGPVPVGYLKIAPGKHTSIEIGSLPTLIGAEYTFTFENMNIERGLLWNQEPAVSRGIQVNRAFGKFNASLSWNDGFYSNRYTWLSGALTYASGPHSLEFVAGGNYNRTGYQTAATPVQNNSSIWDVIYTYSKGHWTLQPYFQYTSVPAEPGIGIVGGSSTKGGAILISHSFGHGASLAGRWEYLTSTGSVNLLFGPGSDGLSFTLTPTLQYGGFFVRGDLSWVHAISYLPGSAFGATGMNADQPRALAEIGFLFGDNIAKTH